MVECPDCSNEEKDIYIDLEYDGIDDVDDSWDYITVIRDARCPKCGRRFKVETEYRFNDWEKIIE